jgi:hypothetical protein
MTFVKIAAAALLLSLSTASAAPAGEFPWQISFPPPHG